ncbi:LOG family protein [bacterium]|nr:LOG family protein [bacterium]
MKFIIGFFEQIKKTYFVLIDSIRCWWLIRKMPKPIVTFFGSKYTKPNDPYYILARDIATDLVRSDRSVLTGGGPGIMQAANLGASKRKNGLWSAGVIVKGLPEPANIYSQKYLRINSLDVRKKTLIFNSCALIFLPGGFGTLDEFFVVALYAQLKYLKKTCIVLVGKKYWNPLLKWIDNTVYKSSLVGANEIPVFKVADTVEQAVKHITCHLDDIS